MSDSKEYKEQGSLYLYSIFYQNVQQLFTDNLEQPEKMYLLGAANEIMRIILKFYHCGLLEEQERADLVELLPEVKKYCGTPLYSMLAELEGNE